MKTPMLRYQACYVAVLFATGCAGTQLPVGNPGASAIRPAFSHQQTFQYTGTKQSFVVPSGVTAISVVAVGAAGGGGATSGDSDAEPGRGGRVIAQLPVTGGERLGIFVGGTASGFDGGYNGGGAGKPEGSGGYFPSFGGGGATDIREGGDALKDRILVAGGGGGIGGSNSASGGSGGAGGGRTAGNGANGAGARFKNCSHSGGGGGGGASEQRGGHPGRKSCQGQSGGLGEFGIGGNGGGGGGGVGAGGGGGYYGGGGGGAGTYVYSTGWHGGGGGGGGGSSYVESGATKTHIARAWKGAIGNGSVIIRWN